MEVSRLMDITRNFHSCQWITDRWWLYRHSASSQFAAWARPKETSRFVSHETQMTKMKSSKSLENLFHRQPWESSALSSSKKFTLRGMNENRNFIHKNYILQPQKNEHSSSLFFYEWNSRLYGFNLPSLAEAEACDVLVNRMEKKNVFLLFIRLCCWFSASRSFILYI